jgi:YaiO family outer membrane protein
MERRQEAFEIADRLTVLQPQNDAARQLRDSLRESLRVWQAQALYRHDTFDDDTASWQEGELSLRRRTRIGSVIARVSQARRFERDDTQFELDFYPSLRDGTYLYLSAGAAPGGGFFPDARFAADVYQSLGAGFEATAGYRRLEFDEGVDIYTAAVSKYHGRWLLTLRGYGKPDSAGDSLSVHVNVRRYLGNGIDFVGLRFGTGSSREELLEDVAVLDSDTFGGEAEISLTPSVALLARGGYSREERLLRDRLGRWSGTAGFAVKF